MEEKTWMILMIVMAIMLLFLICMYWDVVKSIFAAVGAAVLRPYTRWKRKKAEKAYFQFIEEHKAEFIEELMKQTRNEILGQQGDKEEEREDEKKEK